MPTNGPPAECTVRLTVRVMTGAWLWLRMGPPSPHWSHLSLVGGQPLPHTATRLTLTVNILSLIPHQHIQSLTAIQPHTSQAHTISHNYSASYLTSTHNLSQLFSLIPHHHIKFLTTQAHASHETHSISTCPTSSLIPLKIPLSNSV